MNWLEAMLSHGSKSFWSGVAMSAATEKRFFSVCKMSLSRQVPRAVSDEDDAHNKDDVLLQENDYILLFCS